MNETTRGQPVVEVRQGGFSGRTVYPHLLDDPVDIDLSAESETAMLDDYEDVREHLAAFWTVECWNCGHTWWVRRASQGRVCKGCFQGQGEERTDYGRLWYGEDVPVEEMRRRYAKMAAEMVENTLPDPVEVRLK